MNDAACRFQYENFMNMDHVLDCRCPTGYPITSRVGLSTLIESYRLFVIIDRNIFDFASYCENKLKYLQMWKLRSRK